MHKNHTISQAEFDRLIKTGRFQAIVKDIGGSRYLIGLERPKTSSKYHEKLLLPQPLNLTALVARKKLKEHFADLWDIDSPKPSWWRHPILRVKIALRARTYVPPKPTDSDPANTPANETR
jgi:hypothetical protein